MTSLHGAQRASTSGLTKRHWTGLALVWLAVSLPFILLYFTSRRVVINEVRNHAMGVAIAIASNLDVEMVKGIDGRPEAESSEAYIRLRQVLDGIRDPNPDVKFIYLMRRSRTPLAPPSAYEYIVDASPVDLNGNGKIDEDEASQPPGTPYDASDLPEMVRAWDTPSADYDVTPDPPYPDLLSGYAPVRNEDGQTVAIVGVDVLARTVSDKLLAVRVVMLLVWFLLSVLITLVIQLYYQQRDAFDRIKKLNEELESRNELLRQANDAMARHAEQYQRELRLAQAVQEGFLPTQFPRGDRIIFDKYYLTCAILGGDLFDVFDVDEDHVGLFMADVAGHGVSAALISGLLKMAISSVRDQVARGTATIYADLTQPDAVVRTLNELLVKEMPESEFITLIYAVVNLTRNEMVFANAGHPWPVHYCARRHTHEVCKGISGMALGLESGQNYPVTRVAVEEGDKVLFYTDGLTEAMNGQGEEFGEERFTRIVDLVGDRPPSEIIAAVRDAVSSHRGSHEVSDDFSMLVAEIR